jgi:hypothetical protein
LGCNALIRRPCRRREPWPDPVLEKQKIINSNSNYIMQKSRFIVAFLALVALAAAGYSAATTTKAKAADDCCDSSCCSDGACGIK